ncbi:hypothetical protein GIB67_008749 [Kingdonia uniflora]|uniref:Uncharacterized protein n=1 Tax=Kingdonia uniflora TaxID=39325 RepID=A0A7J7P6D4_9MAGN|nr:hypothetical protein GIB67_008749 [Kingdonia uniflora]
MKSIHVCLILGIRVTSIHDDFLFFDPQYAANFRIWQFPRKKNTYGLKEIDGALKQAKLDRHYGDVLRLNLLKIILFFLLPNKGRNVEKNHIEAHAIGDAPVIKPAAIGSSFSSTDIGAVVVKVEDEVEVVREVNLEAISSEYGGDRLEKGAVEDEEPEAKEKDNEDEKDGDDGEKAKSVKEEPLQVANEEEVQIVVVYFINKKDIVEEANKTSVDQTTGVYVEEQSKEEMVKGNDDDDETLQKKPLPMKIIIEMLALMESEVDVILKKRHKLTDEDINDRALTWAYQMNLLQAYLEKLLLGVLYESFIQRPIS